MDKKDFIRSIYIFLLAVFFIAERLLTYAGAPLNAFIACRVAMVVYACIPFARSCWRRRGTAAGWKKWLYSAAPIAAFFALGGLWISELFW